MQRPLTHPDPISSQCRANGQNVPMPLSGRKKKYDVVTSSMSRSTSAEGLQEEAVAKTELTVTLPPYGPSGQRDMSECLGFDKSRSLVGIQSGQIAINRSLPNGTLTGCKPTALWPEWTTENGARNCCAGINKGDFRPAFPF
jgi:hypothetical protein